MKKRVAAAAVTTVMICGAISGCSNSEPGNAPAGATPTPIVEQRIQPADTCSGITQEADEGAYHHVALPADAAQRKDVLVLYMVGSLGTPENSLEISQFAASLGYGVLNIRYPNTTVVGVVCFGRDDFDCYGQYRGETIFGENVAYSAGSLTYDETSNVVSLENSVVSRAACLLDYLAHQAPSDANSEPTYWRQFLREAPQSPYATPNLGKVYPAWSKIIVAGHSQGGGMAPMLAMNITPDDPARRVVMFSAVNDSDAVEERSASWIQQASATPLDRYWGIRHPDDTTTGTYIQLNWSNLGGAGSGGVGGPSNGEEIDIGDGSGEPAGRQRLVLTVPVASSSDAHSSTVNQELAPEVVRAWTYLFTAGGTD